MREHLGRSAHRDVQRFFEAAMFNWASMGTDAHAKNYALRYGLDRTSRPEFAPLYDLGSTLPFPEISDRTAKLAMSFDGRYRIAEIEPHHITREAEGIGLDSDWARGRARELVANLPDAFSAAVTETQLENEAAELGNRLIDAAADRSGILLAQLGRV
jgi:serine/threonine-protein kinase HipA